MVPDSNHHKAWGEENEGAAAAPPQIPTSVPPVQAPFSSEQAPNGSSGARSQNPVFLSTASRSHGSEDRPTVVHSSAWVTLLCFLLALIGARLVVPYMVEEMRYAWHRGELRAAYEISGDGLRNVSLDSITQAYEMVVDRVGPSVVHIDVVRPNRSVAFLSEHPSDQGSGVVVSSDGFILTNEHVISDGNSIRVTLGDGRRFPARLVGTDAISDLALLKIDTSQLIPITWGNSDSVRVGMPVWAMGSPFGLERTVTSGILSGIHRAAKAGNPFQDFMQSDAAVNPGNSGGPLVDSRGQLIGINTAIVGDTYRGVSFSIPSNVAQEVFLRLKADGTVTRGWLGVRLEDGGTEANELAGALVTLLVQNDSPAALAGIQVGDLIIGINNDRISDSGQLTRRVAATPVGTQIQLKVRRGGVEQEIAVKIGARPAL